MARTRRLNIAITGESRDAERAFDEAGDAAERFDRRLDRVGRGLARTFVGFGRTLTKTMKPLAGAAALAFSTQFLAQLGAALTAGTQTLVTAVGGALALLPAAALAGVVAFGTLKLAVLGVGEAISAGLTDDTEAFNEALKKLSPSARNVTRDIVSLKGRFDQLKGVVQERFFAPLTESIKPLGFFLMQAQIVAGDAARTFGQVANAVASWLKIPTIARSIFDALVNVGKAVENVAIGVPSILRAFLPLVTVGAQFLPQLTRGFSALTARVAIFMEQAERTGQLRAFIQDGIDAVRQMIATIRQWGRVLGNIGDIAVAAFDAIGVTIGAGGLLDKFERATESAERFVKSARGSKVLSTIFETIGKFLSSLRRTLEQVFGVLADFIRPLLPDLGRLFDAFLRLKSVVLDVGLDALAPILGAIGAVLSTVVLPALTGLFNFLASNRALVQGIAIAILTLMVPAFVAWAISAGIAAINTLLLFGPIILIGAAIAGLAALFIIHWNTIKNAVLAAFNFIKSNWRIVLAVITGGLSILPTLFIDNFSTIRNFAVGVWQAINRAWQSAVAAIKGAATGAKDWIVARFNDVMGFITGLPGRIASAASGMWDGIKDAFVSAINSIIGLWNGLSFPSVTIGGQDPLGPFGPSLPEVTIGGWDLPNIPTLAAGGIVTGPTLAMIGEAGDEAVVPLGRSGFGGDTIVIDMRGAVIASGVDAERFVTDALNRALGKNPRAVTVRGRPLR